MNNIMRKVLYSILILDAIEENPNYCYVMLKEIWK